MYGLTLSIDDKKYDGYRREMLRDVITQVRLLNDLKTGMMMKAGETPCFPGGIKFHM